MFYILYDNEVVDTLDFIEDAQAKVELWLNDSVDVDAITWSEYLVPDVKYVFVALILHRNEDEFTESPYTIEERF